MGGTHTELVLGLGREAGQATSGPEGHGTAGYAGQRHATDRVVRLA